MASAAMSIDLEDKVLEDALSSPAVAMMRLSIEIERELRLILATIGRLRDYTGSSPNEAFELIAENIEGSQEPVELRQTIRNFWDLRNQVIHTTRSQQDYAVRAIDYGLRILRMLKGMPRPSRIVRFAAVPLCSDSHGTKLRTDVRGVILESFSAQGESCGTQIFPSRNEYHAGESLTWEWNSIDDGWDETWYIDPLTKEIKLAWTGSLEFVGRPLDLV